MTTPQKARNVAQAAYERSIPPGGVISEDEFQHVVDGPSRLPSASLDRKDSRRADLVDKLAKKRGKYLRRFSKRFAVLLQAKAQKDGSTLSLKEAEFIVGELFSQMDVMRPIETIGLFRMIADWCGITKPGESKALTPSTALIPKITFRRAE